MDDRVVFIAPHRMFLHSATSHGLTANNVAELTQGMPQKTIFDSYVLPAPGHRIGLSQPC